MSNTCPVCEEDVSGPDGDRSLVSCRQCGVRFLPAPEGPVSVYGRSGATVRANGMAELPPELAERFELQRLLGVGGMGSVYLAHERPSGRPVAIKFLTRTDDEESRARFLLEGRLLAGLRHRNVVSVLATGRAGDHLFLIMEYVEGGSLRGLMRDCGRFEPAHAVAVVRDVLAGLQVCHARGVVHRDIKPENILVRPDGSAVLTDLGIAKDYGSADAAITRTGIIIGTPRYMAPEQLRGEPAGTAADLFAVGLVLHELLSGDARRGARLGALPPPLSEAAPHAGPALARVVARALEPRPGDRFSQASEFRHSLASAIHAKPATTAARATQNSPVRAPSRVPSALSVPAALGALMALTALLAFPARRATGPAAPAVPAAQAQATSPAKPALPAPAAPNAPAARCDGAAPGTLETRGVHSPGARAAAAVGRTARWRGTVPPAPARGARLATVGRLAAELADALAGKDRARVGRLAGAIVAYAAPVAPERPRLAAAKAAAARLLLDHHEPALALRVLDSVGTEELAGIPDRAIAALDRIECALATGQLDRARAELGGVRNAGGIAQLRHERLQAWLDDATGAAPALVRARLAALVKQLMALPAFGDTIDELNPALRLFAIVHARTIARPTAQLQRALSEPLPVRGARRTEESMPWTVDAMIVASATLFAGHDPAGAEAMLRWALARADEGRVEGPVRRARILHGLLMCHDAAGSLEGVEFYADQYTRARAAAPEDATLADVWCRLGTHRLRRNPDDSNAYDLLGRSIALAARSGASPRLPARAHLEMGRALLARRQYSGALRSFQAGLEACSAAADPELRAQIEAEFARAGREWALVIQSGPRS